MRFAPSALSACRIVAPAASHAVQQRDGVVVHVIRALPPVRARPDQIARPCRRGAEFKARMRQPPIRVEARPVGDDAGVRRAGGAQIAVHPRGGDGRHGRGIRRDVIGRQQITIAGFVRDRADDGIAGGERRTGDILQPAQQPGIPPAREAGNGGGIGAGEHACRRCAARRQRSHQSAHAQAGRQRRAGCIPEQGHGSAHGNGEGADGRTAPRRGRDPDVIRPGGGGRVIIDGPERV